MSPEQGDSQLSRPGNTIPGKPPPAPPTQPLYSPFPPNTAIKDFGYSPSHPLHRGNFARPLLYDGIEVHGLNSPDSDLDEDDLDDYGDYHPYISPVNHQLKSAGKGQQLFDSIHEYDDDHIPDGNNDFNDYNDADDGSRPGSNDDHHFSNDEINRKAIALFDFTPENDNEVGLTAGQLIWISYRHGQGWLVAEDPESGENGLVPEEYVEIYYDRQEVIEDIPKPFLPAMLQNLDRHGAASDESDSEWVDTDYDDDDDVRAAQAKLKDAAIA